MTADDARDRVTLVRAELRRAMRALCKPDVDWGEAEAALLDVLGAVSHLYGACQMEDFERRRYDSAYRQGDDHGCRAPQDGA